MKKSLIITLLVFVFALVPWWVSAQDCDYINFKPNWKYFAGPLDPPISADPPYDGCWEVTKLAGNLNGRYQWCFYDEDFELTSDSIYGDGFGGVFPGKYYSRIVTRDGEIELVEWSWFDEDSGFEGGMIKVVGGTGDFEDASGALFSVIPPVPGGARHLFLHYKGYICTP